MKPLSTSFLLLAMSASFAAADDPAPQAEVQHRPTVETFTPAQLDAAARKMATSGSDSTFSRYTRVSGPLPRVVQAPQGALQLINPFAPARYGGSPVTSRAFSRESNHETGLVLLRVSW
jgi:hypothetical protein